MKNKKIFNETKTWYNSFSIHLENFFIVKWIGLFFSSIENILTENKTVILPRLLAFPDIYEAA